MNYWIHIAAAGALLALPVQAAAAGAGPFTIVNATGTNMTALAIKRHGTEEWRPLGATPAAGARGPISFSDPDCAFDIRATLAGGSTVIWSGVNLCEAKVVILNRNETGSLWVDYE